VELKDYNACVKLYADNVYRFIVKQLRDKDAARDVVQDSFEKLWRSIDVVPAEKAKTWLFTTAYRGMIDYTRKQSRQTRMEPQHEDLHTHTSGYSDLKEVLNEGLSQLPEIQKTVILLRDYEGYDYEEIGNITGLSESQVKVYIFRARTFLKNYIGRMEVVI